MNKNGQETFLKKAITDGPQKKLNMQIKAQDVNSHSYFKNLVKKQTSVEGQSYRTMGKAIVYA